MSMSFKKAAPIQAIRWKVADDEKLWLSGGGPADAREWIRRMNAISNQVCGRGIVVTRWKSNDHTAHNDGSAVDVRRLGAANKADKPPYTLENVSAIETAAAAAGLPIYVIAENTDNEHWHIGRITLAGR